MKRSCEIVALRKETSVVDEEWSYYVFIELSDGTKLKISEKTFTEMGKPTVGAKIDLSFSMPKFDECVEKMEREAREEVRKK